MADAVVRFFIGNRQITEEEAAKHFQQTMQNPFILKTVAESMMNKMKNQQ